MKHRSNYTRDRKPIHGFTLVELLVVIAIIALLLGILIPVLGAARTGAKIIVVHAELYGISMALEAYHLDNGGIFPSARADCSTRARPHAYPLPSELIEGGYLNQTGKVARTELANTEDRFNKGYIYKYITPGHLKTFINTSMGTQTLYMPPNYPHQTQQSTLKGYNNQKESPATYSIFSVGPNHNPEKTSRAMFPIRDGFPIVREFWYNTERKSGILTRIRIQNGQYIGTFQSD
jgi:prepilin-type N-terminal cleavage/methylation domain-containing protein